MSSHTVQRAAVGTADRLVQIALIAYACALFAAAAGFFMRAEWALELWPFRYHTTRMSYIFVSSIFAAAGTAIAYCGIARDFRAMAGVGIDAAVILSALAVIAFAEGSGGSMRRFAILSSIGAVAGSAVAVWSHRYEFRDARPTPMGARIWFGLFVAALWLTGGALAAGSQRILPWEVAPLVARIYGWMFLGASSYFLYGILVPRWSNGIGQFLSFLAYDLVLLFPFIDFFKHVEPGRKINHIVYTTVVILSAIAALYYCFVKPGLSGPTTKS